MSNHDPNYRYKYSISDYYSNDFERGRGSKPPLNSGDHYFALFNQLGLVNGFTMMCVPQVLHFEGNIICQGASFLTEYIKNGEFGGFLAICVPLLVGYFYMAPVILLASLGAGFNFAGTTDNVSMVDILWALFLRNLKFIFYSLVFVVSLRLAFDAKPALELARDLPIGRPRN